MRTFRLRHSAQWRAWRSARSLRTDHVSARHAGRAIGPLSAMTFASRARYWLPLLPLFGLLGFTYWLNQLTRPEPGKPDNSKRHEPDAIVENFSAIKLNEQGAPHFIMAAKKMLHYPDDDSTTQEVPHLTSLPAGRPAIHAIATRGVISSKGDEVFLQEDVEV